MTCELAAVPSLTRRFNLGVFMAVQTCPFCSGRFHRLDRHLASRRGCGQAAAAARARAPTSTDGASSDPPTPPDLGPAGAALWRVVVGQFEVRAADAAVLACACREADAADAADQAVTADGRFIPDRFGTLRLHPGVGAARSARLAQARLLRALGIPAKEAAAA
jgi:hypothetical protein